MQTTGSSCNAMTADGIAIPVSPGELLDKISILEIKVERIADPLRNANVRHELLLLREVRQRLASPDGLEALAASLKQVNQTLWNVEDEIRECERNRRFDDEFIRLARSVYQQNDQRADLKRQINVLLRSAIVEEKSYSSY
jgi:hypothetical protein